MPSILDLLANDPAFSAAELSQSVMRAPFVPGRLGAIPGLFDFSAPSDPYAISVAVDHEERKIQLIAAMQRGTGSKSSQRPRSKITFLPSVRLPDFRVIKPEMLKGIRPTDSNAVDRLSALIAKDQISMRQNLEATLEFHRCGSLAGIVMDADGTTPLLNLYDEFGVSAPTEVAFNFASNFDGKIVEFCSQIEETITDAIGGLPYSGIHAMCGRTFWQALRKNKEIRDSYQAAEAAALRAGITFRTFEFGGVTFEHYRGAVGTAPFVAADKARFFPVGVPGLFRQTPTAGDGFDWIDVTGEAQAFYSRLDVTPQQVRIDVESDPVTYCTIPEALVSGRSGA
jgi:Phage major capsid protein E